MIEKVGYFLGKLVKVEDGLSGLKKGFEKFFNELKEFQDFEFSAKITEDKLITKSKCPIHKYFGFYCDKFCLSFVEGFARAYGVTKVRRVERQPKSDYCVFEFEI
ncbi:hypothetical protein [Archaeoglobus profundus]|uniref:4-vinyl reductase 4VR domain-containing protein n=1 Tax=Archaeoglobus profundus (strain DSM 5631 / JCM 9629 / NBRC 100127 / Av18) TaxID=572546 RepID=D2RHE8_ARCPA|nr:hypothetical protein [Archaeoglobus profundus]ADB57723.1 hypothetical protein Arcpr_0658 [Archaeoglobus profundus DSM 5631]